MKIATAIAICLSMVIIAAIVLRNLEDHAENIASFRRSIMANKLAREDDEDVQGQLVEEAFEDAVAIAQILRRGREIQAAITRGVMREGGLGGRSGREGESAEFNDLGEDADAIEMDDLDAQGHLQSQGDNTHSDGHDGHDPHHGQGEDPDSDDGLIELYIDLFEIPAALRAGVYEVLTAAGLTAHQFDNLYQPEAPHDN